MFPELKIKNANNVAWLPENCVAAYFNFFVIGKLNERGVFTKNEYLKFRFVDFENFLVICLRALTFFSWDPLLSKEEDVIIETPTYQISLQGKFEEKLKKKQICIKVAFSDLFYELDFDKKEFDLLINGFLKISVDVFCCCHQTKSMIRVFFEKLDENIFNDENYMPEIYLQSLEQKDYFKLCLEICKSLEISNLSSYYIFDQITMYKKDLLTITTIKSWYKSSLALDGNEKKSKVAEKAVSGSSDSQAFSVANYNVNPEGFCEESGSFNNNGSFNTDKS